MQIWISKHARCKHANPGEKRTWTTTERDSRCSTIGWAQDSTYYFHAASANAVRAWEQKLSRDGRSSISCSRRSSQRVYHGAVDQTYGEDLSSDRGRRRAAHGGGRAGVRGQSPFINCRHGCILLSWCPRSPVLLLLINWLSWSSC
jgi:hypothetical protein